MTNEATDFNIIRKAEYVDNTQMVGKVPLFSWVDLNVTELCNRACVFCPRVDPDVYPNQNLNMSLDLVRKIAAELKGLEYQGVVVLSGFGEPLLHPEIIELARCLSSSGARLEIVTNGDSLSPSLVRALVEKAGVNYFVVSLYDSAAQVIKTKAIFDAAGVGEDKYVLRDRWWSEDKAFGLKLTNRAGVIDAGPQPPVLPNKSCYYPAYSMMIDWNGDVLLCLQDWNKTVKFGNVEHQSMFEIWVGAAMARRRVKLITDGRGKLSPCKGCNVNGTVHGESHVQRWVPGGS